LGLVHETAGRSLDRLERGGDVDASLSEPVEKTGEG
jgi:hypothetical protein